MFKNKNYVLTILKEGGFSKAAEVLFISQPSLSATVKRIEEKIGAPIFDRSTTPISLTEIGAEYVRYANEISAIEKNFEKYVDDNFNLHSGKIRIGGSSFFSAYVLPYMISEFNKEYPAIQFELFEDNTKSLIEKVREGKIDLAIDNSSEKFENITPIKYMSEMLLLAVPRSFEINENLQGFRLTSSDIKNNKHKRKNCVLPLSTFSKEPFVLLNTDNDTGKRALHLFEKYHITPNVIFQIEQQLTAYNISSRQLGISFVSDTLVKNVEDDQDLYYYRLSDQEIRRNINFYIKNTHYISNACQKFIEYNT